MGSFMQAVIPADSIDLSTYCDDPFGSHGEANLWLAALLAEGSDAVGILRRQTSVVSAIRRAALKSAGITFEVAKYSADKDENGKRIKLYDPPATNRMGAVFARAENDGTLQVTFVGLKSDDDDVTEDSRRVFTVRVK